ncbi:GNAT family N-acetyltransferase [Salininema proteolyticum]|uniref:GNAT family N-acetyltransferase n=1 Tax=Salininema proteolyticum TaxID=1607685 RepID=A0ABV8TYQ4_9ACTN
MEISYIEPGDTASLDALYDVYIAAFDHDVPRGMSLSRDQVHVEYERGWPMREVRHYLLRDGNGAAVAGGSISLFRNTNTESAGLDIVTDPGHRRKGYGTAVYEHLLGVARAEGRGHLLAGTHAPLNDADDGHDDAGRLFAEKLGFDLALTVVNRVFAVDSLSPEREAELFDRADAKASADYELRTWTGPAPEELQEGLARIDSSIMAEVPLGDIDLEPAKIDVDQRKYTNETRRLGGYDHVQTVAIHRGTGDLVANTVLLADRERPLAYQGITIVNPGHRGHRLGQWLKIANLRALKETKPHVAEVYTDNADVNAHMNAINEAMGFRPLDLALEYQKKLS